MWLLVIYQKQNNYDHMVIQAPRDGYIGVAQVNLGDTVSPGTYLFSFLSREEDKTVFINLPWSKQCRHLDKRC